MLPLSNPVDAPFWDTALVHQYLADKGEVENIRATERLLEKAAWLPKPLAIETLVDEYKRPLNALVRAQLESNARKKRLPSLVLQHVQTDEGSVIMVNDGRKGRRWCFLDETLTLENIAQALLPLLDGKSSMIWPQGELAGLCRQWVQHEGSHQIELADDLQLTLALTAYGTVPFEITYPEVPSAPDGELTHLDRLEAESIHIIREVVAQAENPVMLYSVGKDSAVMLHLARKAFYPSPPPFPLMHVDTRWKFQAMYDFRNRMAEEMGMELIVHINPEGVEKNINPFDHGSALHTDIMKTQGLKQALDQHGFDVAFGGARRDEEKSRAKERVFSFRNAAHRWDPKNQRPELWNLYNGYKSPGESIRVFPLSNWTELDIWQYIYREEIPIVPLYFAAERPVIERDGMLMMVDDERLRLLPDEEIVTKRVRFRTLGCYPLTGAIESNADDLPSIVLELLQSRTSERQGRAIDTDSAGSMEKKKQEGYF